MAEWENPETNLLSPIFEPMVGKLLQVSERCVRARVRGLGWFGTQTRARGFCAFASRRLDWNKSKLRTSCYEAVNQLIVNAASDKLDDLRRLLEFILSKLGASLGTRVRRARAVVLYSSSTGARGRAAAQIVTTADRDEQVGLQIHLCAVIQVLCQRLDQDVCPYSDQIMDLLYRVRRPSWPLP